MPGATFLEEIDKFVEELIVKYKSLNPEDGKVIHDALWGTFQLQPHEVSILDTPLIQRLRQIKQTGFTFLIFPSATHTRFEHTLGVTFQAQKLLSALSLQKDHKGHLEGITDQIRMAALLHDCGHGLMSHTSEDIYKYLPDMQELIGSGCEHEEGNPHELLSYYIIKNDKFKDYFNELMSHYNIKIDIEETADIIIGNCKDPLKKYITDTINGPFDADKLDYLFRDGHFSGLPLTVDLDRLWYSVRIEKVLRPGTKEDIRMLIVSTSGITPLEQILFSKMVLFTSVYHHHKVRACDCMMKAIHIYCIDKNQSIGGKKLNKSTDFLWVTDDVFFAEAQMLKKDDPLHIMIHNILYRRLFKRALIMSKTTVEEAYEDFFEYTRLKTFQAELYTKDGELRELAKKIWRAAGEPCSPYDVWVDLPKLPPIGSADDTYVSIGTTATPQFEKLSKIFKVDDWAQTYAEHKWRGHVFCPHDPAVRKKISAAAKDVLESEFSIKFKDSAITLCKNN